MTPTRAGTSAVVAVLGAAVLLLALVTWAASIGPDPLLRSPGTPVRTGPVASNTATVEDGPFGPERHQVRDDVPRRAPGWLRLLATALEVLAAAALAALTWHLARRLLRRWRDRRRPPERSREGVQIDVRDAGPALAETVATELEWQHALLADGDPRNAIVACWHRFETAAERAGARRRPWQTPSEFVLEVLEVLEVAGADPDAATRLADLYREARFSDHPVTEDHRRRAQDALGATHRSLSAPAPVPVPGTPS